LVALERRKTKKNKGKNQNMRTQELQPSGPPMALQQVRSFKNNAEIWKKNLTSKSLAENRAKQSTRPIHSTARLAIGDQGQGPIASTGADIIQHYWLTLLFSRTSALLQVRSSKRQRLITKLGSNFEKRR
jgi:hypothetical protein